MAAFIWTTRKGRIHLIRPAVDGFGIGRDVDREGNSRTMTRNRLGVGKEVSELEQDGGKGV